MKAPVTTLTTLLVLLFCTLPTAQAQPDDGIVEGVLLVKLDEAAVATVEAATSPRGVVTQTNAQDVPLTGVASLDQLNQAYNAARVERVFRPAGQFEERHREFGLHRWYRIEFSEGSTAQTAAGVQSAVTAYATSSGVTVEIGRAHV